MMITKEADSEAKQEGNTSESKISKPICSSTSWTRLKDPRIVRVSRAFGGKDRHSKVCTVRGLRDRRVRLSVPTAIQLYDLQDRLGFNQPSKVVDWLLNAAKHGIDELPPLQLPPGNFPQNLYPMFSHDGVSQSGKGLKTSSGANWDDPSQQPSLNIRMDSNATLRSKSKEITEETTDDKDQRSDVEGHGAYVSSDNFFSRPNQSSLSSLMNNSMSNNSVLRWDPSSLSLSHAGTHRLTAQQEEFHNFNVVPLPSTVHMPSGSQVVVYPSGLMQSYFSSAAEFDPKHVNLQILGSSSQNSLSHSLPQHVDHATNQPVRPFHFSMMTNLLPSQNSGGSEPNDQDNNQFQSR